MDCYQDTTPLRLLSLQCILMAGGLVGIGVRPRNCSACQVSPGSIHFQRWPARFWKETLNWQDHFDAMKQKGCHQKLPEEIWNIWVFPKIVVPQNGWFIMENPIKMDDLGGPPLFLETPIFKQWDDCLIARGSTIRRPCEERNSWIWSGSWNLSNLRWHITFGPQKPSEKWRFYALKSMGCNRCNLLKMKVLWVNLW